MTRGQPDFGAYAAKEVSATLADMGELAARLGSVVIYDRRGDVIDFDNFEETILRWSTTTAVTGDYCRLDSGNAKSGSQSVKLYTAKSAMAYITMSRGLSLRGSDRIGIEISFSNLSSVCELIGGAAYYDGTNVHYARWKIIPGTEKLYVYDNTTLDYVEIAGTGAIMAAAFTFYTIKMVFDISTGKYIRLLFSNNEYDVSSYPLYSAADTTAIRLLPWFALLGSASDTGNVWLDDFIITQNEP